MASSIASPNGTFSDSTNVSQNSPLQNATWNISNVQKSLPYEAANWTLEQKIGTVAGFVLLIVFTILGNLTIILAILKDPILKSSVINLYYLSLAFADLLVGLLVVPLMLLFVYLGYWPLGNVFCDVWLSVDFLCCCASFYTLAAISWDRYRAVSNPLGHLATKSRRRVTFVLVGAWIAAGLVWVPAISIVRHLSGNTVDYYCMYVTSPHYVLVSCVVAYYIPMTAMVILYALIYTNIQKALKNHTEVGASHNSAGFIQQNNGHKMHAHYPELTSHRNTSEANMGGELSISVVSLSVTNDSDYSPSSVAGSNSNVSRRHPASPSETRTEKQRRAAVTLGVVMAVFLICWCPWTIIWPLESYRPSTIPQWLFDLSAMAAYINSFINPFLYVFSNPVFRSGAKRLLTRS